MDISFKNNPDDAFQKLIKAVRHVVYIVHCSSGRHDEYSWWIGGIFKNVQDALASAKKMNDEKESDLQAKPPFEFKFLEDLTVEQHEIYADWQEKNYDAQEWHTATVEAYELK